MKTIYPEVAVYLLVGGLIGFGLSAQVKKEKQPDPVELILEKSNQTMRQAGQVSAKVDRVVVGEIKQMKQTIEVLEVEKEMLIEQVNVMQDEIVSIKSAPMQPFDVLAILPDSTGGGE